MSILIVEDDKRLAQLLEQELTQAGYETVKVHRGDDALKRAQEADFDLIILDLNLPDMDGIEVAEKLKDKNANILMLTARGDVGSRIEGLYAGASDYMTKPFSLQELLARVHVRLRERAKVSPTLRHGALELDPVNTRCTARGEDLDLEPEEFKLLELLLGQRGHIFSADDLKARLYGADAPTGADPDALVSSLRDKLSEAELNDTIRSVRGAGYVIR